MGDSVSVHVDYDRRSFVAPNHTMTHVLNYALRSVLLGPGKCSAVLALLLCVLVYYSVLQYNNVYMSHCSV